MVHLRDAGRYFILVMAVAFASHAARAEVTGIEIASRADVLAGKPFGAGAYEKIIGKVYFAVNPASAANQRIVDIDKAARDNAGRVRFSADLYALVPKESARGNGACCSTCSTAAARTCWSPSTGRRRGTIRPRKRISATAS
jgi:hypothetical protein